MTKWCHNSKTGEIFSYIADFPKGDSIVYRNYLTIGFRSKEEAVEWSKKYNVCSECTCTRSADKVGSCLFCRGKIPFNEVDK